MMDVGGYDFVRNAPPEDELDDLYSIVDFTANILLSFTPKNVKKLTRLTFFGVSC